MRPQLSRPPINTGLWTPLTARAARCVAPLWRGMAGHRELLQWFGLVRAKLAGNSSLLNLEAMFSKSYGMLAVCIYNIQIILKCLNPDLLTI